jgi:hypothetical protein
MSLFRILLLATVLTFAIPAWAEEIPAADSLVHSNAAEAHVTSGDTAHAGAHEEGIGPTLVHILAHHLIDADEIDLFGLTIHLPTFQIGELKFITKHQVVADFVAVPRGWFAWQKGMVLPVRATLEVP